MTNEPIETGTLGLAAEFAVASELCRRGIYAQLTLGNRKSTDLLVEDDNGQMLRVQVKAKQKREWPGQKGVSGPNIVLVLVDYQNKQLHERPDFFILTPTDWKQLIRKLLVSTGKVKRGEVSLDKNYVPTQTSGYPGNRVNQNDVQRYKEQWENFDKLMPRNPTRNRA